MLKQSGYEPQHAGFVRRHQYHEHQSAHDPVGAEIQFLIVFELTARKELTVMALPGPDTSRRNIIITTELTNWARKDGTGMTFDCACRFILPNGANRGPDASWLRRERWDALTPDEKRKGAPLCPEFLVELMSPSDRLADQKEKMTEYTANGLQLGWLVDPDDKTVYVYRPGVPPETLKNPATLSGDPVLPR